MKNSLTGLTYLAGASSVGLIPVFIHRMDEQLTHEQLVERIRSGAVMNPVDPGVSEAAREVFRPLVEDMNGKEIIYYARGPWLIRVDRLRVYNRGFFARTTPLQRIQGGLDLQNPFKFAASWEGLRLFGNAIGMFMSSEHFYTDQALVAEIKAALARGPKPGEITEIFNRPRNEI